MKENITGKYLTRIFLGFVLLAPGLPCVPLFAQDPPPVSKNPNGNGASTGNSQPAVVVSHGKDYLISPGDVIDIKVEDAPELSRTFRVTASGMINFGFLGQLNVQKKSTEDLSVMIADGLRGRYLKNPLVSVTVTQFNSQSYYVQGAVSRPGQYQMEGRPDMLELLTIAGGLAPNHGSTAFIIRRIKDDPDGQSASATPGVRDTKIENNKPIDKSGADEEELAKYELLKAPINGLLIGNFEQNIAIRPGDIINIPQSDIFFVAGEVKAPGSYALREGTTVQQAISLAQGMTIRSKSGNGLIFRTDPKTGKREEIKIDIGAIMAGKKPDFPILANDIIMVPNSRMKSIGTTLLSGLGANAMRIGY